MSIITERKQTFYFKDIMRPFASLLFQREIFVLYHTKLDTIVVLPTEDDGSGRTFVVGVVAVHCECYCENRQNNIHFL